MRIGLLGNSNNNLYVLLRFLLDDGYDAELLLFHEEPEHFSPLADSLVTNLRNRVRLAPWAHIGNFLKVSPENIRADLAEYDVLIGSGIAVGFLEKAGRQMDLLIPYGSEMLEYPYFKITKPRNLLPYNRYVLAHRQGMRRMPKILLDYQNPWYEGFLDRLKPEGRRFYRPGPFCYYHEYAPEVMARHAPQLPSYERFREIRSNYDLVLFHHSSHNWHRPKKWYCYKGNDHLFNGFASFIKRTSVRACIITCEYGAEVHESKRLCAELGIQDQVHWFPVLPRKEIMAGISMADAVVGEMPPHFGYLTYGVSVEAMVMAKPLIASRDDSLYTPYYPSLYPMLPASDPASVAAALDALVSDPDHWREQGQLARRWFLKYGIEEPLDIIKATIAERGQLAVAGNYQ